MGFPHLAFTLSRYGGKQVLTGVNRDITPFGADLCTEDLPDRDASG